MAALVARGASEVGLGASAGRAERWAELARQARTTVAAANLCPPLSSPSAQPLSSCVQPPLQLLTRPLQLLTARTQARREIIEPSSEALQAYLVQLRDAEIDARCSAGRQSLANVGAVRDGK